MKKILELLAVVVVTAFLSAGCLSDGQYTVALPDHVAVASDDTTVVVPPDGPPPVERPPLVVIPPIELPPDEPDEPPPVVISSCDATVRSGGYEGYSGTVDMKQNSGSFVFVYNTYTVPDEITIYDGVGTGGEVIFKYSGGTERDKSANVTFNDSNITIKIVGSSSGTAWNFKLNCPDR